MACVLGCGLTVPKDEMVGRGRGGGCRTQDEDGDNFDHPDDDDGFDVNLNDEDRINFNDIHDYAGVNIIDYIGISMPIKYFNYWPIL